jgi:preprotein translocase subunit YajC
MNVHGLTLLSLALQTRSPRQGGLILVIYVISFGLIAWFVLIRPQRKLQEEQTSMLSQLKRNDEVMTDGGIIGTIIHIAEDRITIRTGESTKIVVARQKIARVIPPSTTLTTTT